MMPYARALSVPLLALTVFCTACAKLPGVPPDLDRFKPMLRLAVSLGVDRLLTQHPDVTPLVLATTTILADVFNAGDFTSIAMIGTVVRAKIPWEQLPPNGRIAVEALLDTIGEELRLAVARHQIPEPHAVVFVREMVGWVREVALRHLQGPVKSLTLSGDIRGHRRVMYA